VSPERRARLRARIERNVLVDTTTGCWIWQRLKDRNGYGRLSMRTPGFRTPSPAYAHRVAFAVFTRTIRDGYHLDHLCCRKSCCNPGHLQEVLPRTNSRRAVARAKAAAQPEEMTA
jgi:hypothetical protein